MMLVVDVGDIVVDGVRDGEVETNTVEELVIKVDVEINVVVEVM